MKNLSAVFLKIGSTIVRFTTILSVLIKPKIFCISFQRTGTKSVEKFFKDHGFNVAWWGLSNTEHWNLKWFTGNYEAIFSSLAFKRHQVFQDSPWWCGDFYKFLFHRFPAAKFVLLERDADKWFDSMMSHSEGKSIGNTHLHSSIYRRENDFFEANVEKRFYEAARPNLLLIEERNRDHYKEIYLNSIREMRAFFQHHAPDRLFYGELEDADVWQKMAAFFNVKISPGYQSHAHKTKK